MRSVLAVMFGVGLLASATGCAATDEDASDDDTSSTSAELNATGDGINTCGGGHNESCAAKVPVKISDSKTILLAKYDITAGRFRQFVNATNGNLRGYIEGHEPAWWNGPWRSKLASHSGVGNMWNDVGGYGYDWTVWLPQSKDDVGYLVGPWQFGINAGDFAAFQSQSDGARPAVDSSMYGPANEGCEAASYGARTYWQPNGATGGDDNAYPQSALDRKALNCASFYTLAAFCAWDGGRLPTTAELDAAWGAETYPWGTTNPYYADFDGNPKANGPKNLANYGNSDGAVYANPAQKGNDQTNHISSPGEFPRGDGPYGNSDLVGNVISMTGDIAQDSANQTDNNHNGARVTVKNAPVVAWHRGGSWQGHTVEAKSSYRFIATNRYLAMGGRCAYDNGAPAAASFPIGFTAEYFADKNLTASKGKRVDPYIATNASTFKNPASSNASTPYGVRWTATLTPRYTESYTITTTAGDGMRVWIGGKLLIDDWTNHGVATKTATIALKANTPVSIKIEHYNASGNGTNAKVLWSSASQLPQVIPASALKP